MIMSLLLGSLISAERLRVSTSVCRSRFHAIVDGPGKFNFKTNKSQPVLKYLLSVRYFDDLVEEGVIS